jgi:hypothetical protein
MRIRQRRQRKRRTSNKKRSTISRMSIRRPQKDRITDHNHRRTKNDKDLPAIKLVANSRDKHCEKSTDGIWRNSEQLLRDSCPLRINGPYDGGQEEGEALYCDVVEEEDDGC